MVAKTKILNIVILMYSLFKVVSLSDWVGLEVH